MNAKLTPELWSTAFAAALAALGPRKKPTRWQRICWWLADHRPTIHLGPCEE